MILKIIQIITNIQHNKVNNRYYMFDQLLNQFENVFQQAKQLKGIPKVPDSFNRGETVGPDITKPFGKAISFNKSQRFKHSVKQQLKTQHIQWKGIIQPPKLQTGFKFKSSERFQQQKPKYVETYINPDINVIKKSIAKNVPIYKKPVQKDLTKSNVSVSTVSSEQFRGPGLYKIKDDNKVKNGAFLRDSRFKEHKKIYQDTPLMINESQTRKKPPLAVIKKKTAKTKNLISIQQQEDLRQKMKYIYWRNVPLEIDRLYKNNQGAIIRDDYFNLKKLSGVHKRAAIILLLNKLHILRGGYENNIRTQMDNAHVLIYRKSTPKPFKFSQMDPGPDYYYPTDDLINNKPLAFSFGKEGLKPKIIQSDMRDYQIDQKVFRKGGNIIINPVHKQYRLTEQELKKMEMGPGFYDCLFSQTQARNDVGVLKFQQITDKNARQNNCVEIKQVNDGIYYPSYQAIDPNISVPLYKQPANVKPVHLPDKILFPQHWLFYDGDLNKVRAEIAKNVILAKNMNFEEYKIYKEKFQRFKQYIKIQKAIPEVGQYQVKYDAIDAHIAGIDMEKKQEKGMIDPIKKPDQLDGDNLILNPKDFEQHLPNINFKKLIGRQDNQLDKYGQPREGDKLILNPQKPQKHLPNIDFKKQQGREDYDEAINEQGVQGDILIIHPKLVEKHIGTVNFQKQAKRQEIATQHQQLEEVIITNPIQVKPAVKGVPFSRLSSVRMVPVLRGTSKDQKKNSNEQN